MATYITTVNEKTARGRHILALLKSMDEVELKRVDKKQVAKAEMLSDLKTSVAEAKAGKTKPLKELFNDK